MLARAPVPKSPGPDSAAPFSPRPATVCSGDRVPDANGVATTLACRVVTEPAELEALRSAWEELLARSGANEPVLSPLWLFPWWQIYGAGTGRALRIGLFYDGERLVGLAPLHWRRYRYRRCLPFERLEPLGADVDEQDGVCSDYLNLVIERGYEEQVAEAFARAMAGSKFGTWDEFVLPAMDGDGPIPNLLVKALGRFGFRAESVPTGSSPYVSLPATWDDYLNALGKKKRYLIRAQRDFEKWAGSETKYHSAANAEELSEGKRILIALHGGRWQSAGLAGLFRSDRFATFHDRVMSQLLDQRALDLSWLTVRGKPIAALYQIVWNNKVYFYQCGRSIDVPKNLSPGTVILGYALRRAIEAGRREFDFLAGLSFYKSQLAMEVRPLIQVRVDTVSLRQCLRQWFERGIESTRGLRRAARSMIGWLGGKARRQALDAAP